jgi:transposase
MKRIKLMEDEAEYLREFTKKGQRNARALTRAHVLLLTHRGEKETTLAEILNISRATASNIKKRYREEGLENALKEKTRPGQPKKYSKRHEAEIIALTCISPPEGRKRWSWVLLAEELEKKGGLETINRESIRLILKKAKQNLG